MTTMFDQRDAVAFQPVSIIGVFWPFGGPQAAGPSILKPGGVDGWDSYAVSDFPYRYTNTGAGPQAKAGLFFQPVSTDKQIIVGLNVSETEPGAEAPERGIWLKDDATCVALENGIAVGAYQYYSANDVFLIGYDGPAGTVTYSRNGVAFYTSSGVPDGLKMWAVAIFNHVGGEIRNVQFGPLPQMRFPAKMHNGAGTTVLNYFPPPGTPVGDIHLYPGKYIDEVYDYPGDWDERMEAPIP